MDADRREEFDGEMLRRQLAHCRDHVYVPGRYPCVRCERRFGAAVAPPSGLASARCPGCG